ncbi:hypothetical protein L226DRAFT_615764 [Lentinus tigrinus ALCF2SS1-7]|uniref:F-box domain-containing protein n=1 Tax=Lentinus tigrinus ALCF2SS1-6 TaxID=1328759 RepID=A0A5C2RYV3_9APHY|nr:hypothetical protein L227DRAFT_656328 [Lentinus tigrinus ALCF2SS1-6]RPD71029.1 hypothetical protein L226DRAFT_615764 [Lentinus tigrinus ALCF2SS1-7]
MLLLVNKLPTELLVAIFSCIVDELDLGHVICLPAGANDSERLDFRPLTCLTHVCRHWRDVAMHYPPFWSSVVGPSLKCVETCLTRSAPLPASVYLSEYSRGFCYPDDCRMISPYAHRIARLDIEITPLMKNIQTLLPVGLTGLECLNISSWRDSFRPEDLSMDVAPEPVDQGEEDGLDVENQLSLPAGVESNLKALALKPVVDVLPWGDFKSLTHLFLAFNPDYPRFDVNDIVATVAQMPALRHLHLSTIIYPRIRRRPALRPRSIPVTSLCMSMSPASAGLFDVVLRHLPNLLVLEVLVKNVDQLQPLCCSLIRTPCHVPHFAAYA